MRQFRDRQGSVWEVWEVSARVLGGGASNDESLEPELLEGWLCFLGADDRRRLTDFPLGWQYLPEHALMGLCERAGRVTGSWGSALALAHSGSTTH